VPSAPKESPARRGAGVKGARVGLSRLPRSRLVPADVRSNRRPRLWLLRVAPAHDEPRSGSNNSERESTSGRSTNYGSGHLIRVFRDIGRIFSLLFLLSHPSPVWSSAERKGSKAQAGIWFRRRQKRFQLCFVRNFTAVDEPAVCHSPKQEPRPVPQGRGLGNPARYPRHIRLHGPHNAVWISALRRA
jgi:hypothetical protein